MCNNCCSWLLNVYWFCGNHILTKSCISTKLVNVKHIFHVCKHKNYLSNLYAWLPTKVILWHCYKPGIFWLTESFENAFSNYNIKLFTVIIPFWAYFKHVALFSYLEISRDKIIFHFISHFNMFYNAIIGNAQHKS